MKRPQGHPMTQIDQSHKFLNPPVPHTPEYTIVNRNVHISVLHCIFWDMGWMHYGICESALLRNCICRKCVMGPRHHEDNRCKTTSERAWSPTGIVLVPSDITGTHLAEPGITWCIPILLLTNCGLGTPYGATDLGHHWFRGSNITYDTVG